MSDQPISDLPAVDVIVKAVLEAVPPFVLASIIRVIRASNYGVCEGCSATFSLTPGGKLRRVACGKCRARKHRADNPEKYRKYNAEAQRRFRAKKAADNGGNG